jgi:hypothetical protein
MWEQKVRFSLIFAPKKKTVVGIAESFVCLCWGDCGWRCQEGDLSFTEGPSSIYGRGPKTKKDLLVVVHGIPRINSKSEQTRALISLIVIDLSAKENSRAKHAGSNFIIRKHTNVLFVIQN